MGDGSCATSGRKGCGPYGNSNRWWTSADHVRGLVHSRLVLQWKVALHPGRSVVADKPRAKLGDSGRPRGKPACVSARRDQAAGRTEYRARIAMGESRRTCTGRGSFPLCLREYGSTPELISNFATLSDPFDCIGVCSRKVVGVPRQWFARQPDLRWLQRLHFGRETRNRNQACGHPVIEEITSPKACEPTGARDASPIYSTIPSDCATLQFGHRPIAWFVYR
jgi:hypothetical protein